MTRDDDFLGRWSRRKHASRRGEALPQAAPESKPASAAAPAAARTTEVPASEPVEAPVELPPVESLTPESDFTPFMKEDVDPVLRRQALRTLFRDPRFNVMDGLDVYIDDYSKPDPIPADWMGKLNQMARLGDYKPPEEIPEPAQEAAAPNDAPAIPAANQEVASETPDTELAAPAVAPPNQELKDS